MTDLIINLIQSDDYKKRLLGEYLELKERYDKLHNLLIKYEAGTLNFDLTCPTGILERQCRFMGCYLRELEIRMEIEGIKRLSTDDLEVES